jgi:hypothetical protein
VWRATQSLRSSIKLDACKFPEDFLPRIGMPIWWALNNPNRREVIRLLNSARESQCLSEIANHLGFPHAEVDNRDDTALSSMTLAFDPTGRIEAAGVMQETLARLTAIDGESRQRATEHSEQLTPYVSGLALFVAAPPVGSGKWLRLNVSDHTAQLVDRRDACSPGKASSSRAKIVGVSVAQSGRGNILAVNWHQVPRTLGRVTLARGRLLLSGAPRRHHHLPGNSTPSFSSGRPAGARTRSGALPLLLPMGASPPCPASTRRAAA